MEIEEMIKKYSISPIGYGSNNGKIAVQNPPKGSADRAALIARVPEIKKYFSDKKMAEDAEHTRREANVASIAGLKEIADLQEATAKWNCEFEKSFDECGGLGVGPRPQGNEKELLKKYPQAAAYLEVRRESEKSNDELATIGKKALDRFEDAPENWESIVADMKKEISKFADRHIWD